MMVSRFSINPRTRKYVRGYGFLSFARNLASSQAARKVKDAALKQGKDVALKAGKRAINKGAEATGDLVGQKVADSLAKIGSKRTKDLGPTPPPVPEVKSVDNMIAQVRNMSPQKRAQIINELSLL